MVDCLLLKHHQYKAKGVKKEDIKSEGQREQEQG